MKPVRFTLGLVLLLLVIGGGIWFALNGQEEDALRSGEPEQPDSSPPPSSEKVIILAADAWLPFNGIVGEEPEGYMIEIARTVFAEHGYTVDYQNVSWKRAVENTRRGVFDGAVGASKIDGEGLIFPRQELTQNKMAFYVRKGNPWRFVDITSLESVCLGIADAYDYGAEMNTYIASHKSDPKRIQVVTGENPLLLNLRKLLTDRIDVVIDCESCILYAAKPSGALDSIELAGYGDEATSFYIAFTPAHERGARYAKWLSDGIEHMRADGRLGKVLERYGLADWQKQADDELERESK